MRNFKLLSIALITFFYTLNINAQNKKIDISKGIITWTGKKITGQHQGTLKFKEGTLIFKGNKIAGGNFVVDMTSLNNTDQTGSSKAKLEGHLKSDDFFGIYNFKTALLDFKNISSKPNETYTIIANLTIKGITNPVIFDLIVKENKASAKLIIDRTKYDIRYGSGSYFDDLGDKTIYDNFELDVELFF